MSDIFKEVDEEIRQENYAKLWQSYGRYVIALLVLLVVTVAGYQLWLRYDLDRRTEASDRFAAALRLVEDGQTADAQNALAALADPADRGYGLLAAFAKASLFVEQGDLPAAIAIWDAIAASSSADENFRAIATLMSALHQVDSADPEELEARVTPLTDSGGAFRASALEVLALIALRRGDKEQALDLYQQITADIFAPAGLRQRALRMSAHLRS